MLGGVYYCGKGPEKSDLARPALNWGLDQAAIEGLSQPKLLFGSVVRAIWNLAQYLLNDLALRHTQP